MSSSVFEPIPLFATQFAIADLVVQLFGADRVAVGLVQSLAPFRVSAGISDVTIYVEWVPRILAEKRNVLFDSGSVWRLYDRGSDYQFDFTSITNKKGIYKRLLVDAGFGQGVLQINQDFFTSHSDVEPLAYPLDELLIMHRLTQEKAIELHGCGIVTSDGTGNLFVGHSGAGKSTTTRLWTASQDVEVLSDDRIIVRRNPSGGDAGEILMYGTPWHGEAQFASPGSAPLKRICILEHGHGNALTRLSPSRAIGELFARAFVPFHRHEYVDAALQFLQELVQEVPCYHYAFEPDQRAVETILNFRD